MLKMQQLSCLRHSIGNSTLLELGSSNAKRNMHAGSAVRGDEGTLFSNWKGFCPPCVPWVKSREGFAHQVRNGIVKLHQFRLPVGPVALKKRDAWLAGNVEPMLPIRAAVGLDGRSFRIRQVLHRTEHGTLPCAEADSRTCTSYERQWKETACICNAFRHWLESAVGWHQALSVCLSVWAQASTKKQGRSVNCS